MPTPISLRRPLSAAVLSLCLAAAAAAGDDPSELEWRGRVLALDALPPELSAPGTRAALAEWSAWAAERDAHLTLDDSARVLLVAGKKAKSLRKELKLVAQVLERADRLFPMPAPAAAPPPPAPAPPADPPPPEDPEDPDAVPGLPPLGGEEPWSSSWETGVVQGAQREALPVLVLVDGDADLVLLLDFLAARHPALASWVAEARGQAGFVLTAPLVGAWLTRGADLEEWSPLNELVNRLTRLLVLQRHGRTPEWLSQGLAWDAERELMKGIYCYPRRHEFVWASEHTAWDSQLAGRFRGRSPEKTPLEPEELCALTRANWKPEAALMAYGGARFLTEHHPDAIAPLMAACARDRDEHARVDNGDGTWRTVPDYAPPPATQAALLEELAGPDALSELTRFFQKGSNYRPRSGR